MAELSSLALEFLRSFNRAVRSLKMYKATHPQVQKDLDQAFAVLASMLAGQEAVVIGVSSGTLLVQGRPVKDDSPAFKTFAEMLRGKNIASIRASRGAKRDEFVELARILYMDPEEALVDDHIKPDLLAGLHSFKISEEGFGVPATMGAPAAAAAPAGSVDSVSALAEAYMRAREVKEDPKAALETLFKDVKTQGTLESMLQFFEKAAPELTKLSPGEASGLARRYLEQAVGDHLTSKGILELRNAILKLIFSMPHDVRRMALGDSLTGTAIMDASRLLRKLDLKIRASALCVDLVGGTEPQRIAKLMDGLAPTGEEYVSLCEMTAGLFLGSPSDPAAVSGAMTRLFRTLKAQAKVPTGTIQGTLLVLDPDAIGEGGYANDLEQAGYTIIRHGDGQEAWDDLAAREEVQGLLLEIKVPGLSGLEILNRLQDARRAIPVVVVTDHAGFREAFEVASYPKLTYLMKPVDTAELRAAVERLLPPAPAEEVVEATPAELERAREVQAGVFPSKAPEVDGYDIAFRRQSATGLGGDFLDVLPLDGGRTGLVVGRVSTRDMAGAMVMLMLRTVLRNLAPRLGGAKETIVEVHRLLGKDMPRSVTVSLAYAVLDPARHSLAIADAGHNAPLVWAKDFGIASFLPAGKASLGTAVGAEFESSFNEEEVELAPRDRLVLYTNGVVAARDPRGAPFTEKRFLKLVNFGGEKSGAELIGEILGEVDRHRGGPAATEDLSIVCLTRQA